MPSDTSRKQLNMSLVYTQSQTRKRMALFTGSGAQQEGYLEAGSSWDVPHTHGAIHGGAEQPARVLADD